MSAPELTADELSIPRKRTTGDTLEDRLTSNAYQNILPARYLRRDDNGELTETQEELFVRVARNIALAEAVYEADRRGVEVAVTPDQLKPNHPRRDELAAEVFGEGTAVGDDVETALTEHNVNKFAWETVVPALPEAIREHVEAVEAEFRAQMESLSFVPNSPTLMNAGDELQQLSACFVDSPTDDLTDIHQTAMEAAEVFQCLTEESTVVTEDDGVVSVAEVTEGDRILQASDDGFRFQPVEAVHCYEDAPTLTVELADGRSIRGTPNHRIKVNGEWARLDEIRPGQEIHHRLGWLRDQNRDEPTLETIPAGPQWGNNRTVSNTDILEFYSQGLSDYEIADRLDCGKSTVQRRRHEELALPPNGTGGRHPGASSFDEPTAMALHRDGLTDTEIATDFATSKSAIVRFRTRNGLGTNGTSVKAVEQPTHLSEELAELVGLWVGDGSWHEDGVRFHVGRESVADYIDHLAQRLFGTGTSSTYAGGCYEICLNSHEIKRWWEANFDCKPTGAQSARIPDAVKTAPSNVAEAFLRGLFTADGTLIDDTYPKLYSSSERLIDDVITLMHGLGYPVKKTTIRDDDAHPYYGLIPTTGQARRAFLREIGFIDERREIGLESIKSVTPRDSYTIGEEYTVTVDSVDVDEPATVYDITVADRHEYITDGVISHNSGGGMGYAFWRLRPYGDPVGSTGGIASGPITFMETFDQMCETIAQGGTRRGAQMAIMRVSHPDVIEFIHAKNKDVSLAHSLKLNDPDDYTYTSFNEALDEARELIDGDGRVPKHLRNAVEGHLSNFNISVGVTDAFMEALRTDGDYTFTNPRTGEPHVATEHTEEMYARYDLDEYVTPGERLELPASVVWERIVDGAWENGEPGVVYLDRINQEHSFPVESTPTGDGSAYEILATNPCVAEGTLVNTPEGYRPVEDIAVGNEISTVIGSEPVDDIEVHEDYEVYRVEFSDGGSLDVTAQHRFHVLRDDKHVEKIPLNEVEIGDHVRLHPTELDEVGTDEQYVRELKRGILLGDGCYTQPAVDRNHVHISTSVEDTGYNDRIKVLFGEENFRADDPHSEGKATKMVLSDGGAVVQQLDLDPSKAPGKTFEPADLTTEAEVMGVLDGLLASDGNINLYSNHPQIRWDTASEDLAQAIRKALLSVGIHGRISVIDDPKRGGTINGRKVSANHPKYTVNVSGASARRYAEKSRIGDVHPEKGDQMFELRTEWMTTGNTWKARVESIERLDDPTTVYDLYCSESDTWITEGYVQQGCGEQPLMEYEACNLGHINLSTIAATDGPDWRVWSDRHADEHPDLEAAVEAFVEEAVDLEELDRRVDWGTRFLENVVTMSDFPVERIEETVYRNRKIGLGVMGLAQLYVQLGVRYGSDVGDEIVRQLMVRINHGSKWTSHELASERGSFENWADSKYADPVEHRDWFEHQTGLDADEWADGFSIRNHNTTTVAPTGTTSMVGNTTGGIEPIYNVAYYKNVSDDVQGDEMLVEFDDYFLRVLEANDVDVEAVKAEALDQMERNAFDGVAGLDSVPDAIGDLFVVSSEIRAKEHAAVQCAAQTGVDSAISKTCNFPNSASVEDMQEVYEYIYEHGGKGVTVYRDGTRSKQVLTTRADNADYADLDEAEAAEAMLEQIQELFGGIEGFLEHEDVQAELAEEIEAFIETGSYGNAKKRPRPDVLHGVTQRIETGYGKLYVNINEDEAGRPFELFANIGNSGGFTASFTEALAKTISTALRSGVDPDEIASELQGIRSPKVAWDKGEQIQSIPDAVGTAMRRYLDGDVEKAYPQQRNLDEIAEEETAKAAQPESDGGVPEAAAQTEDATQSLIDAGESPECPSCGSMSLYYSEGCKSCESCGWSEC